MAYGLSEHRHRFAAWCAASAARRSPRCRFSVAQGHWLLKLIGFPDAVKSWGDLPAPDDFDRWHSSLCEQLVACAPGVIGSGDHRDFRYGVAAKLLNCYLKPLFVTCACENISDENGAKRDAIHPPIDRVLLSRLAACKDSEVAKHRETWRTYRSKGWSNFSREDYEAVILAVRQVTGGMLWRIEVHWPGYQ